MKHSEWLRRYSDMLHDAAVAWGFTEIPGRPLMFEIGCDWYVDEPIPLDEVLSPEFNNSEVGLFRLNDMWGYTLKVNLTHASMGYLGFLKFCKPYSIRHEALEAAVESVLRYIHHDVSRTRTDEKLIVRLDKWAHSLLLPQQLCLWI